MRGAVIDCVIHLSIKKRNATAPHQPYVPIVCWFARLVPWWCSEATRWARNRSLACAKFNDADEAAWNNICGFAILQKLTDMVCLHRNNALICKLPSRKQMKFLFLFIFNAGFFLAYCGAVACMFASSAGFCFSFQITGFYFKNHLLLWLCIHILTWASSGIFASAFGCTQLIHK